jgi:hypothetical protein
MTQEEIMASSFDRVRYFVSGAVIVLALFTAGCAHRYYDPYHNDYHRWDAHERVYYQQWTTENHVDAHRDYRHLSKEDQKRYWDWRHNNEHDHDHDHDRH